MTASTPPPPKRAGHTTRNVLIVVVVIVAIYLVANYDRIERNVLTGADSATSKRAPAGASFVVMQRPVELCDLHWGSQKHLRPFVEERDRSNQVVRRFGNAATLR